MTTTIENIRPKLEEIFEHLHQNPEISWEELSTTEYIQGILEKQGCRITTFEDCTGVIGEIGSGSPKVAVRADLDALWQEVDGVFRANHSCGHDAHMTIVLGVLLVIKQLDELPNGTVKFIFQPAEEKGTGALKMVEKQVVDDVDYLYGVHLRPKQELDGGCAAPAIHHGAARFLSGKIVGDDAHGARPHLGVSAVEVGAAIVQMLNSIHLDPFVPYSAKITQFNTGGGSANIIAGSADFNIDVRAQTNEAMEELASRIEHGVSSLSKQYGIEVQLKTEAVVAAAEVSKEAEALMAESIENVLGQEKLKPPVVTTGGDDFHFYTLKRPSIKATMLALGCNLEPGLHHPKMTFDREEILTGVNVLAEVVQQTLAGKKEGAK